jgi:hypothetical protein
MNAVGMTGRCDKIDTKPGKVKERGIQNVGIRLAGVAACRRYLAQLQGPAEQFFKMLLCMIGKCGQIPAGYQIIPACRPHLKVLAETDKGAVFHCLTLTAKGAAPQIYGFGSDIYRVLWTDAGAFPDNIGVAIGMYNRQSSVSVIERNGFCWIG